MAFPPSAVALLVQHDQQRGHLHLVGVATDRQVPPVCRSPEVTTLDIRHCYPRPLLEELLVPRQRALGVHVDVHGREEVGQPPKPVHRVDQRTKAAPHPERVPCPHSGPQHDGQAQKDVGQGVLQLVGNPPRHHMERFLRIPRPGDAGRPFGPKALAVSREQPPDLPPPYAGVLQVQRDLVDKKSHRVHRVGRPVHAHPRPAVARQDRSGVLQDLPQVIDGLHRVLDRGRPQVRRHGLAEGVSRHRASLWHAPPVPRHMLMGTVDRG